MGGVTLSEGEKSCVPRQFQNLSDSELIQLINSTFEEQRDFAVKAGRNCA